MAERVLEPLAKSAPLAGRVRSGHRVVAVGRARLGRTELVGHPLRAERPFRVLVESAAGEEMLEADVVLDASGVYDTPAAVGAGGVPARGEREPSGRLCGTSARWKSSSPRWPAATCSWSGTGTPQRTPWASLRGCGPRHGWSGPRGRQIAGHASRWPTIRYPSAARSWSGPTTSRLAPRVSSCGAPYRGGRHRGRERCAPVAFEGGRGGRFDAVVGLTGYRPDLSFLSELALEIGPASEGPARLARAVSTITDCLSPPMVREEDLLTGEPGFQFVGGKSYGRFNTFLLKTGQAHLESVLSLVGARAPVTKAPTPEADYPKVPFVAFDTLWFQVAGTLCNLECTHCFVSALAQQSQPRDDEPRDGEALPGRGGEPGAEGVLLHGRRALPEPGDLRDPGGRARPGPACPS